MTKTTPHILSQAEAEAELTPYLERINRCIQGGWDAWHRDYKPKHHILQLRARAAIIFDEIAHFASAEFDGDANAKVVKKRNTLFLYVGESLTLRFKKIGRNGRCSNVHTQRQMLFMAQMPLPGLLAGTLVHAGYCPDDIGQTILKKAIVCQLDKRVLWQIELSVATQPVLQMTPESVTGADTKAAPRFVAKKKPPLKVRKAAAGFEE